MPVTKTRLSGVLKKPLPPDMYKNVLGAYGAFDPLVTH